MKMMTALDAEVKRTKVFSKPGRAWRIGESRIRTPERMMALAGTLPRREIVYRLRMRGDPPPAASWNRLRPAE